MDRNEATTRQLMRRRQVVFSGGGLVLAALAGASGAQRAAADEATPSASLTPGELAGSYVAIRERTLQAGLDSAEVLETIRAGYVPLARQVPGFVAYLGLTDPASRQTAFVVVCADKAGTDESTRLAGEWLTSNNHQFFEGDPIVIEGRLGVAAGRLGGVGVAATPVAAGSVEGNFAVIRARKLKADRSGDELLAMVREGFLPIVTGITGFVTYLAAVNEATRDQFSIGIYADKAGADESTALAAEWGRQGASDFVEGDPIVIEGIVGLAAVAEG